MSVISPTITTDNSIDYSKKLAIFLGFASVIHVDITDGVFAPSKTLTLNQLHWPKPQDRSANISLHLMVNNPLQWLDQIISLAPDEVILHAEIKDAGKLLPKIFSHLKKFGIRVGLAFLPNTKIEDFRDLISNIDTVLIFGGKLGYQGGEADLEQLTKIDEIREINDSIVIQYDGGANLSNIEKIAQSGVDIINVGSAISGHGDYKQAYDQLSELVTKY